MIERKDHRDDGFKRQKLTSVKAYAYFMAYNEGGIVA